MTTTQPRPHKLSDEDFRRLGIRLRESRSNVIRQAAVRNAAPIACDQLETPSDDKQQHLVRVATSTYRLLNPRLRQDFLQRVSLGRISPDSNFGVPISEPNSLPFAAKPDVEVTDDETDANEVDLVGDALFRSLVALDLTPPNERELPDQWCETLSDHDLLSPRRRGIGRFVNWRSKVAVGIIVVVVGGGWLIAALGSGAGEGAGKPEKSVAKAQGTGGTEVTVTSKAKEDPADAGSASSVQIAQSQSSSVEPSPDSMVDLKVVASESVETERTPVIVDLGELTPVGEVVAVEMPDDRDRAEESDVAAPLSVDVANTDISASDVQATDLLTPGLSTVGQEPPDDVVAAASMDAVSPKSPSPPAENPFLPNPFDELAAVTTAGGNAVDEALQTQSQVVADDVGNAGDQRHAVPGGDTVEVLRDELARPNNLLTSFQIQSALQQADQIATNSDVGDTRHYAATLYATGIAWLEPKVYHLGNRVADAEMQYAVTPNSIAAESYIQLIDGVPAAEYAARLFEHGFWLVDECLTDGDIDHAMVVAEAIERFAAEHGETLIRKDAAQLLRDVVVAKRLAKVAREHVDDSPEDLSGDSATMIGRYRCFILRQWDLGIVSLAAGSDRTLTSVAKQELDLLLDGDDEKQLMMARRWLGSSKRHQGRFQRSMLLRSLALAESVSSDAHAGVRIGADELVESVKSKLPKFVRLNPLEVVTVTPATMTPTSRLRKSPSMMSGRLIVGPQASSNDIRLLYEVGAGLSSGFVTQIGDRLSLSLDQATIELAGTFILETSGRVRVDLPGHSAMDADVSVDAKPADANVELKAGTHKLVVRIPVSKILPTRVAVVTSTGQQLAISPDPQRDLDLTGGQSIVIEKAIR